MQLHHTHRQALLQGAEDSLGDLEGLWEDHPNPLVAYGFHALPVPGYQTVSHDSCILLLLLVCFCLYIHYAFFLTMFAVVILLSFPIC